MNEVFILYGRRLSGHRKLVVELVQIFGIGSKRAQGLCNWLGFSPNILVKDLTENQRFIIQKTLKEYFRLEVSLREELKANWQRYLTNGSIHGYRLRVGLPVRGQRTHSNGRRPRKVASVMKKRLSLK